MAHEMGTFRIGIEIENPARPGARAVVPNVLVVFGGRATWCCAAPGRWRE